VRRLCSVSSKVRSPAIPAIVLTGRKKEEVDDQQRANVGSGARQRLTVRKLWITLRALWTRGSVPRMNDGALCYVSCFCVNVSMQSLPMSPTWNNTIYIHLSLFRSILCSCPLGLIGFREAKYKFPLSGAEKYGHLFLSLKSSTLADCYGKVARPFHRILRCSIPTSVLVGCGWG
jgi:hypothetical protein